jgi:hypothetical protein
MTPPHNQSAHDRYNSEQHPRRPFGSQLGGKHSPDALATPPLITVRPIRPRFIGPCKGCGDRYFGCECEIGDEA